MHNEATTFFSLFFSPTVQPRSISISTTICFKGRVNKQWCGKEILVGNGKQTQHTAMLYSCAPSEHTANDALMQMNWTVVTLSPVFELRKQVYYPVTGHITHPNNTAMIPGCCTCNVSQKSHSISGQFYNCSLCWWSEKEWRLCLAVCQKWCYIFGFYQCPDCASLHCSLLKAGWTWSLVACVPLNHPLVQPDINASYLDSCLGTLTAAVLITDEEGERWPVDSRDTN